MPNQYFKFKQFTVHQDNCAMKVCTDACLFGAWMAERLQFIAHRTLFTVPHLLDIGTGTGLLSLMLAQSNIDVEIDAVEIDEAAAEQAGENFEASQWRERLHVYNSSIQHFAETVKHKYDVIVSNPPFYESDLKSDDAKRNLALHSNELMLEELMNIADKLLIDDGSFFVLLPYYRTENFIRMSEHKFFIKEKVLLKQTPKHNYFRSMLWLTKHEATTAPSEIIIMADDGKYTGPFISLLKAFYLYL